MNSRKLSILSAIIAFLLLQQVDANAERRPVGEKPNIVFFLVDDFGWGALSSMGSQLHETPNIDKLAASGMSFTNAYAACTVCSPSRAAILTGAYPARIHLTDWISGHKRPKAKLAVPDWKMYIDHERVTLAEALQEQGYATSFIGKWHLIPHLQPELMPHHYPESHGFDQNIGGREWGRPLGAGMYFHPFDLPNVESKEGDYLTDRLTDYAVEFIEEKKEDPFFLYFSYYTVHGPIIAKPELLEKYQKKLENGLYPEGRYKEAAGYAAMVQSLDESVGRVLEQLEKSGVADNTIIVFTGDNGPDANVYTGGLRNFKAFSHEGGIREPLFISGPGISPSTTSNEPVIGMDFYPTLLDLTGAPPKPKEHVDGVSLRPVLQQSASLQKRSLFWHYPHYHRTKPYSAVRNGDYKLIEFLEDGRLELYNLAEDEAEKHNLAQSAAEKTKELLAQLNNWRKEVGAQHMSPNPNYNKQ